METVGKWTRDKGNILVTIKKQYVPGRKHEKKIKYLGDEDDPCSPLMVSRDLREYFPGKTVFLITKTRKGGEIDVEDKYAKTSRKAPAKKKRRAPARGRK